MAVRVFNYTVSEDSIAASSMAQGGVQNEHNATQVNFITSDSLVNKLTAMQGEGKTFCYRFDRYDGAGGMTSTDPITFVPGERTVFPILIEQWQTKYGGTIQVFFVITLNDNEETGMELYAYCVKLMLKPLPSAEESDGSNYEAISTLAMVAKNNAEKAEQAAQTATEMCERTETARAALEGGAEWVFDGGNASSNVDINFVVDKEMSDSSNNLISNSVIKKYVDEEIKKTTERLNLEKDYVVEAGNIDGWTYRKWNSGLAECWRSAGIICHITKPYGNLYESDVSFGYIPYPFTWVTTPTVSFDIVWAYREGVISYTKKWDSPDENQSLATHTPDFGVLSAVSTSYNEVTARYYVIGKWKW